MPRLAVFPSLCSVTTWSRCRVAVGAALLLSMNVPGQTLDIWPPEVPRARLEAMGLSGGFPVQVRTNDQAGARIVSVTRGTERLFQLSLEPHSVRAPGFQVLAERADGRLERVAAPASHTFRGHLVATKDSVVSASVVGNRVRARIRLGSLQDLWLESADADGLHVLYRTDDVLAKGHTCGALAQQSKGPPPGPMGQSSRISRTIHVADLACDADFEYFSRLGSTRAVVERIESVVHHTNLQFDRQCGIQHWITGIVIQTSPTQPYTSTSAPILLNQFRNHWESRHRAIRRDLAQLFTGKNLDGNTIGIAWTRTTCGSYAYSVVQQLGALPLEADLSAHEFGHNWGATHCDCPAHTMNPRITGARRFSAASIRAINRFRKTRTCLSSFSFSRWKLGLGLGADRVLLGDVNRDGRQDAVAFHAKNGDWWVATSTGSRFNSHRRYISGFGLGTRSVFLADVNADGRADAVAFHAKQGDWWVALATTSGNGFGKPAHWKTGLGLGADEVLLADVNGDRRADAVAFHAKNGDWWVALARKSGEFGRHTLWKTGLGRGANRALLADVTGDRRADAVAFHAASGDWWVAPAASTRDAFLANAHWATGFGLKSHTVLLADVTGDGAADAIAFQGPASGDWWTAPSVRTRFTRATRRASGFGLGATTVLAGRVDRGSRADLVSFQGPRVGDWWVMRN